MNDTQKDRTYLRPEHRIAVQSITYPVKEILKRIRDFETPWTYGKDDAPNAELYFNLIDTLIVRCSEKDPRACVDFLNDIEALVKDERDELRRRLGSEL